MGALTLHDVDDALIHELERRAARNGRSAEAEHRLILEQVLKPDRDEFIEMARRSREELKGRDFSDSTEIIRRSRESGWSE